MGLTLDILEGQNFARKNHHGVAPRRAGAAELAAVDALDREGQFVGLEIVLTEIGCRSTPSGGAVESSSPRWGMPTPPVGEGPERHPRTPSAVEIGARVGSTHGRDPECPPDELSWPPPQTPSWERLEIVLTQIGGAGGVGAAGAYARA
jgi:hypothetical protein